MRRHHPNWRALSEGGVIDVARAACQLAGVGISVALGTSRAPAIVRVRHAVLAAVAEHLGNQRAAARALNIDPKSIRVAIAAVERARPPRRLDCAHLASCGETLGGKRVKPEAWTWRCPRPCPDFIPIKALSTRASSRRKAAS